MEDGKTADAKAQRHSARDLVDVEALRELIELMGRNDLVELEYEYGDLAVRLSKRPPEMPMPALAAAPVAPAAYAAAAPAPAAVPAAAPPADNYLKIKSPMVGTFYAASGPDSEPFVTVGSTVGEDTVVCLIEAMKVFNEIKAGVAGKVVKVCAANEGTVEFDQVLFLVEPH
ncbi:MAG: acetyl-CoA carboxylase biotin carboxyl carrier protein [Phycisphaerae bacterium]|nr:acetyl-CoA carboxylase biotin carboxyl carrier protein [Phycisphaerae bacterium]